MDTVTRERIARLLDEMLRRGVPLEKLQPIIDWLDEQMLPHLRRPRGHPEAGP